MGLFIYRVENRPVGEQGRAFRLEFVNLPSVSLHLPECNLRGNCFRNPLGCSKVSSVQDLKGRTVGI